MKQRPKPKTVRNFIPDGFVAHTLQYINLGPNREKKQ